MERHWRTHLSSELDFFPVHYEKLRFAMGQRQIVSDQMRSCVHQGTGYSLDSWMTAKVWKSRCQSPSAPSPCDWHPLSWFLKTPSPCWSSTLLVMGHLLQPLSRTEGFQMSQKATRSLESEMDLKTRLSGAINLPVPTLHQFQPHWNQQDTQASLIKLIAKKTPSVSVFRDTHPSQSRTVMLPLEN